MNRLEDLVIRSGVEVVSPDERIDPAELEDSGFACSLIEVSEIRTLDEFIEVTKESVNCPDDIIGPDDLFDKIVDLYWISDSLKPVLIFSRFDFLLRNVDDFDRNILLKIFASLDRFWKLERLPHYSRHSECLYVLQGEGIDLTPMSVKA